MAARGRALSVGGARLDSPVRPKSRDRDVRLVAVLLEEQPLDGLGLLVIVLREHAGPAREEAEDRIRLGERTTVIEDERRHAQGGIELAEYFRTIGAVEHAQLAALERDLQLGEQQADLVTVAGDVVVV